MNVFLYKRALIIKLFLLYMLLSTFSYADSYIPSTPEPRSNLQSDEELNKSIKDNFLKIDNLMASIKGGIERVNAQFKNIDFLIENKEDYIICQALSELHKDVLLISQSITETSPNIKNSADLQKIEDKKIELKAYEDTYSEYSKEILSKKISCPSEN